MCSVKGDVVLISKACMKRGADVAWRRRSNLAIGINDRSDAGVRCTKNPAMVLDSPHADHVEMLPGSAGIAIPAIVGDVDEHLRSLLNILANLVGKDGFITDESPIGMAVRGEDDTVSAGIEGAYFVEQTLCKEKEALEGNVLAKRNQVHLVVASSKISVRRDKRCGVEKFVSTGICIAAVDTDVADDNGSAGFAGERRERIAERRILLLKRRGRLGPDNKVG